MKTAVKNRIDELYKRTGALDLKDVVADMKRKDSPLHACVEWDKSAAHEIYLADRARELIREYWVTVNETPGSASTGGKVVKIRKYHSLPVGHDKETGREVRRYFPIDHIRSQPILMNTALQQALDDLNSFRLRYQHLSELGGVMIAIDKALVRHSKGSSRRGVMKKAA